MRNEFLLRTDCGWGRRFACQSAGQRLALVLAPIMFAACGAFGQSTAFEVASVKPNTSGDNRSSTNTSRSGLTMRNVPLKQIIERAYQVKDYSLSGPDWLSTTKFDITAKPPSGTPEDQFRQMLQSLLADRFKMTVHRDSKTLSAY